MLTPPCVLPWGWARRPVATHARYQPGPASHSAQPLPSPSRRMPSCYLLSFQQCVPRHPKTNAVAPPPSSTPPRLDGTPPPSPKSHLPPRQLLFLPTPTPPSLLSSRAFSGALFLWSPESHLFSRWFSRIPFAAAGQGQLRELEAARMRPRSHGGPPSTPSSLAVGHPLTRRIFLFSGHLQSRYELSTPGGTFPSYFMGQNLESSFATHHRPLCGLLGRGRCTNPPGAGEDTIPSPAAGTAEPPATHQRCLGGEQRRIRPLSVPRRSWKTPVACETGHAGSVQADLGCPGCLLLDSLVSNKGSAQPAASPPPPCLSPGRDPAPPTSAKFG